MHVGHVNRIPRFRRRVAAGERAGERLGRIERWNPWYQDRDEPLSGQANDGKAGERLAGRRSGGAGEQANAADRRREPDGERARARVCSRPRPRVRDADFPRPSTGVAPGARRRRPFT